MYKYSRWILNEFFRKYVPYKCKRTGVCRKHYKRSDDSRVDAPNNSGIKSSFSPNFVWYLNCFGFHASVNNVADHHKSFFCSVPKPVFPLFNDLAQPRKNLISQSLPIILRVKIEAGLYSKLVLVPIRQLLPKILSKRSHTAKKRDKNYYPCHGIHAPAYHSYKHFHIAIYNWRYSFIDYFMRKVF